MKAQLSPARLRVDDLVRLGLSGLRTRPQRVVLSALGIAIGVAAMIAVVGISVSSRTEVDRRLERLGTNLLRVSPASDLHGGATQLPTDATGMISRIGPVTAVAQTSALDAHVYRNDLVPSGRTGSISVLATDGKLLTTLHATMHSGVWFTGTSDRYPAVVLGTKAAQRLDVRVPGTRLWLGNTWCSLLGVVDPVPLAPEIDNSALVSWSAARTYLDFDGHPSVIYVRVDDPQVTDVSGVLARTAKPGHPEEVEILRPSDAIAARQAAGSALTGLLVGLGAVALLVGGLGVGNTMVISVLERRPEIGLRRSLGATRRQIRGQFIAESLLLSVMGGVVGVALGTLITGAYAFQRGWPIVVPAWASLGGLGTTLVVGAVAGLFPAARASRVSPTQALTGT